MEGFSGKILEFGGGNGGGALVHPGEHEYNVRSLAPFGVPPCAGLTRRPVLLGNERTERLLKQLEVVCPLRVEQQCPTKRTATIA